MSSIKRLVIDDNRTFDFPADHARSVDEAMVLLEDNDYNEVWWDHDLGHENGGDTTTLAKHLVLIEWNPACRMVVHSANPVGKSNLVQILQDLYSVQALPFYALKDYLVKE